MDRRNSIAAVLAVVSQLAIAAVIFAEEAAEKSLVEKTLVVWAAPANLNQKGGSALSIDDGKTRFDGIVFGELSPKRWMAGSNMYSRTHKAQEKWPQETADVKTFVQMAIVYQPQKITIYRNGELYAQYTSGNPLQGFSPRSMVIIGMRHLDQIGKEAFAGAILDARIYDQALSAQQIAALKPKEQTDPVPWAWFTFDEQKPKERTGRFPSMVLRGGAKIQEGKLILDGTGSLFAARSPAELAMMDPTAQVGIRADIEAARRLRNHLLADPYRPTYHFVIPEDYAMPFDPNGAIYWQGKYHLFYIYQENRVHVWGHVSSVDLVHWRQHPKAIFPTPDSPEKGIFSGNCFINKKGEATMLYHGVGAGNCISTSTDKELEVWKKLPSNPIIPNSKPEEPYASWDPHGWVEGDTYYAIFGGQPGKNPKPATVFKAAELDKWSYVGPFLHHELPDIGANEDISCPDFFKLGNKRVLVCISHNRGTRYYVGEWKNEQFHPEYHERMSWVDNTYFAPESLVDGKGRRILWAWIFDQRRPHARAASGWSGEMALPRELTLGEDGRLRFRPVEELSRLRFNEQVIDGMTVDAGKEVVLEKIKGNTIELQIEIDPQSAKRCGVKVCRSPDGEEQTAIFYDAEQKKLTIDATKSSLVEGTRKSESGPLELKAGETLMLRVFVDRSVVEAFANDRQAVVRRIYPSRPDSVGVSVFSEGGAAKIRKVTAWEMGAANAY